MSNIRNIAEDTKRDIITYKAFFIAFSLCALVLSVICIRMYMTDEVITGEGQDSRVIWMFLTVLGVMFFGISGVAFLYEYLRFSQKKEKTFPIFITSVMILAEILTCGIMSLKTQGTYGPGLKAQTYTIEEAGFTITFPRGLTLIEETSDENYHRLYAFSKGYAVTVHIYTGWKPEGWNDADFTDYISEEFRRIMNKEIFDRTRTIRFDGYDAIRIVGRSHNDKPNEIRAMYDILHGSTYIRVVTYEDNIKGKPDESFIKKGNTLVSTIRFSN